MLKVMLYGYSYGIRSSRKLERALHHNITFMWLSGGNKNSYTKKQAEKKLETLNQVINLTRLTTILGPSQLRAAFRAS
jgi:transposase